MYMQLKKKNQCGLIPPAIKLRERDIITEEALITTIRRAVSFYSSIQAHDGHWPAEAAGSLFFIQPLVRSNFSFLYV
jgi:lupeol synthase